MDNLSLTEELAETIYRRDGDTTRSTAERIATQSLAITGLAASFRAERLMDTGSAYAAIFGGSDGEGETL